MRDAWAKATRLMASLPNEPEFAPAQEAFREAMMVRQIAREKAARAQQLSVGHLSPDQMYTFLMKRVIDSADSIREMEDRSGVPDAGRMKLPVKLTDATLPANRAAVDAAIAADPVLAKAVADTRRIGREFAEEYRQGLQATGRDTSALDRYGDKYMLHQLLDAAADELLVKRATGGGGAADKGLAPGGKPSFMRQRKGTEGDLNLDPELQTRLWERMARDAHYMKLEAGLERAYDIAPKLRADARAATAAGTPTKWTDLVPDTHRVVSLGDRPLFTGHTIPEDVARQAIEHGTAQVLGDDVHDALVAGTRKQVAVPAEVADALNEYARAIETERTRGAFANAYQQVFNQWKRSALFWPYRLVKFTARELGTHLQKAYGTNPDGASYYLPARREILDYFSGQPPSPNLAAWIEKGGLHSNLFSQEVARGRPEFEASMRDVAQQARATDQLANMARWANPMNLVRLSERGGQRLLGLRDAYIRYSSYLSYLDQLKSNGGQPRNYGFSDPAMIDAMPDRVSKAYNLSDDLVAPYDKTTVLGRAFARNWAGFWRFTEANTKQWVQGMQNVFSSPQGAAAGLSKLGPTVATAALSKGAGFAMRAGRFIASSMALEIALSAWNHLAMPEEEHSLSTEQQRDVHLNLGQHFGQNWFLPRLSAFQHFREFLGLDALWHGMDDYFAGRANAGDVIKSVLAQPVNKIAQAISPVGPKGALELIRGEDWFPNALRPRPIADRGEWLAEQVGMAAPYRKITGRPEPAGGFEHALLGIFANRSDPGAAAYGDTFVNRDKYLQYLGLQPKGTAGMLSDKSLALRDFKLALKYKDDPSVALAALKRYADFGGTEEGIARSMAALDPTRGLDKTPGGIEGFRAWLPTADRDKVQKAIDYYEQVARLGGDFLARPDAQKILEEGARAAEQRGEEMEREAEERMRRAAQ